MATTVNTDIGEPGSTVRLDDEFAGMKTFNGYWKISGTTASKVVSKSYLTNDFFPMPKGEYTITTKAVAGYTLGIRFYVCRSLNGSDPEGLSKSSAYGTISGASAQSVTMETVRAIDPSAMYFSVSVWGRKDGTTTAMSMTGRTLDSLIDISCDKPAAEKPEMNKDTANTVTAEPLPSVIPAEKIMKISFNDAPSVCLSTSDESATEYDDYQFSFFNVLKISDSMYYLYYTCFGKDDKDNALISSAKHLAMAWSTDGSKWTRGIPKGITPPIPGTNLISMNRIEGHHVFRIPCDSEYPFRMITNYAKTIGKRDRIRMYKSKDGANFTLMRDIIMGDYDSQLTALDKGGMLKVYVRLRTAVGKSPAGNRQIGVFYVDYDGNLIAPPTLAFDGTSLYNASAMPIDDHRDLLFPTYYNEKNDSQELKCYILDYDTVTPVDIDTSKILPSNYSTFYVSPRGIVDIGGELYMFYMARDTAHNDTGGSSHIMKAKVTYATSGRPLKYY